MHNSVYIRKTSSALYLASVGGGQQ